MTIQQRLTVILDAQKRVRAPVLAGRQYSRICDHMLTQLDAVQSVGERD